MACAVVGLALGAGCPAGAPGAAAVGITEAAVAPGATLTIWPVALVATVGGAATTGPAVRSPPPAKAGAATAPCVPPVVCTVVACGVCRPPGPTVEPAGRIDEVG